MNPSDRLIVALDTPDSAQAGRWVEALAGKVGAFKVGLEFLHAQGPEGVRRLQDAGAARLFADTKFCDIPNTVAGAVRSTCTALHPWLLNVHALAGSRAMAAARDAAEGCLGPGGARTLVIAVTVLTSLDAADLAAFGIRSSPRETVVRLAHMAQDAGLDGVVASPLEIEPIRAACGPDFLIITPGIRPAGVAAQDQARIATPSAALRAGADYLVVGRALTGADDPRSAADAIAAELATTS
jgi:orotidine-5'-phosphate decarboxylase